MMISPRLNASRASLRSANERLRRMSAVNSRQHSIAAGTEETIVEIGSREHLQDAAQSPADTEPPPPPPANGRHPGRVDKYPPAVVSNGTAR